jgi:hypothetical protein
MSKNIILVIIIIILAGAVGYFALVKKPTPTPNQLPKDETANWETYVNKEIGVGLKYPSGWESPIIKERSIGKCNYKEIYLQGKGGIDMRPKTESAFLCFQPGPYFECGNYYFECSPSLSSFNCQPYKDEKGNYDSMKIWNDLKTQGFNCSITAGRPYASYIYNPDLLQNQFQILERASQATNLDENLEKEIKSDFILFRPSSIAGSDNRFYVELIYNSQIDVQGIKIIGYDGSDISAANYYYRAVFLKDNKIISARFSLFSGELLKWTDNEMLQTKQGKSFNERIIEALKDKNEESQIYEIVREYDLLAKSIYLTF